nr:MAG TPA: hypothetical protein [Bacteriophage sp.]
MFIFVCNSLISSPHPAATALNYFILLTDVCTAVARGE